MSFSDINDGKFKTTGGFTSVFQYSRFRNYNDKKPAAEEAMKYGCMKHPKEAHFVELLEELRAHRRLVDHEVSF